MSRGRLIAFEGIDGCGKSTQVRLLAERLGAVATREPGGTELGAALRGLLLEGAHVSERAEALLMAADRAQHVDTLLRPSLEAGRWVVTDRYVASTLAYQGYGRGLPGGELEALVAWATGGLAADLTVLLEVDPAEARRRRAGSVDDRFEASGVDFMARVAEGFRALAQEGDDAGAWLVLDAGRSIEEVALEVWAEVQTRWGDELGHG